MLLGIDQLDGGVRNAAPLVHHAALGVEPEREPLEGATGLVAPADARRGIQLDAEGAGEHEVDGIEHGGLARTVVAEQEQVPTVTDLDRLVHEVVEADQPHAMDREALHRSPAPGLAHDGFSSVSVSGSVSGSGGAAAGPTTRASRTTEAPSARTS